MNRHPGREEQTIHLLKSIELKKGMKALDLGAGEGETVRIMKAFGLNVQGVDLVPRSSEVQQGDFLDLQYAADSYKTAMRSMMLGRGIAVAVLAMPVLMILISILTRRMLPEGE